jgi:glyoxylase-like metal-dependent hydrolase (beta-lactamase superfamily II)/cytochrome c556
VLDGNIAFNIDGEKSTRQPERMEGALWNDGVHVRRMWMMNNPVVLLRRMMDGQTRLSSVRREGDDNVIDLTLKEGDRLSAGFAANGLPAFVRWGSWHANLGQANFTTWLSGWVAWDGQDGALMPLGYDTRLDWRNIDYFKMYIDGYTVNAPAAHLAAPASVRATPARLFEAPRPITSVAIAPGIWRISNGTTVVAFKDHLVLFELGSNPDVAKTILAYARSLAPGKPIRYLVSSHNHFDHTAGIRQAVAEGITIIQRASTLQELKELAEHKAPDYPDDLARAPKPFKSLEMKDHLHLQDETQTLDLYWGRNNGHMADVVFGYVPSAKLIMEGDMVTAAYDWVHWPDTLRDVMAYYHLEVERISPSMPSPRSRQTSSLSNRPRNCSPAASGARGSIAPIRKPRTTSGPAARSRPNITDGGRANNEIDMAAWPGHLRADRRLFASPAGGRARSYPIGSIHELMEDIVEPSADAVWDSTAILTDAKGIHNNAPTTPEQWEKVRHSALTLVEVMNLVAMDGRRVIPEGEQMGAGGTLDAAAIQARLVQNHADFARHAASLQAVAVEALRAIDARDLKKLDMAGAKIDAACEGCHLQFWYPPRDEKNPEPEQPDGHPATGSSWHRSHAGRPMARTGASPAHQFWRRADGRLPL